MVGFWGRFLRARVSSLFQGPRTCRGAQTSPKSEDPKRSTLNPNSLNPYKPYIILRVIGFRVYKYETIMPIPSMPNPQSMP